MNDTDIQKMIDVISSIEKITGSNFNHWLNILKTANTLWFNANFKVGDFVILNFTPIISDSESPGWLGAKHFLIKGALAKVVERSFKAGQFYYGLAFNDDSWVDSKGTIHLRESKGIYYFHENNLISYNYVQLTCEAL